MHPALGLQQVRFGDIIPLSHTLNHLNTAHLCST